MDRKKKKPIQFGVVQGRLTKSPPGCLQWFPQESWQEEFKVASNIGLNYIELIAEVQHNSENPIWSDQESIISLQQQNHIVSTINNDDTLLYTHLIKIMKKKSKGLLC